MSATSVLSPVNITIPSAEVSLNMREEVLTPTTPRAHIPTEASAPEMPAPSPPTTLDLNPATSLPGQLPLPSSPMAPPTENSLKRHILERGASQNSVQSSVAVDDMDLDRSDEEEDDGSDNDTENGDGRASKKKKGQRFFCTDFPPCNLSFTRSEHLARHIR